MIKAGHDSPNARAIIPCSDDAKSATKAGHASGWILLISMNPESCLKVYPREKKKRTKKNVGT